MTSQEEFNNKLIKFTIDGSKLSLKSLIKFFKFSINSGFKLHNNSTKQSLKSLAKKERNLTKVDLNNVDNEDLKDFHKIAKKCGLKYSLVKDKENGKYVFFFNAKSSDMYSYVVQELEKRQNEKLNKPKLENKIAEKKKLVNEQKLENKTPKLTR